ARTPAGARILPAAARPRGAHRGAPRRAVGRRPHVAVRRALLHLSPAHAVSGRPVSALVAVHDVDFAYPGAPVGRRLALADLTLTVASGEILGVIGPNSAGKTTIIRLLTKVVSPSRGEIVFDGIS